MSTKVKTKDQIYEEASKLAREIEKKCAGVETEVSLDTQEGEDAYIWVTATPEILDSVRVVACNITARSITKGFYILPRMDIKAAPKEAIGTTGRAKAVKEKPSRYTSKKVK